MTGAVAAGPLPSALEVRASLKSDVDVHRHIYRGKPWYVFHDRATDRFYRVSSAGAEITGAMDGRRSVSEIAADLNQRGGMDEVVDPGTLSQFVTQLSMLGLTRTGIAPKAIDLDRRRGFVEKRKLLGSLRNPLALRLPLLDPTRILDFLDPFARFLFTPLASLLWCLVVGMGAVLAVMHWPDVKASFDDRLFSLQNLALAWSVYPVIKIIHEFMHAIVLRHFGGEVRRMGIIIVAFMPVPYVDASSSIVLPEKRWRMAVAAAGIMAELFIASLAMVGWLMSEPSVFHAACYDILLVSGVSTLLFNGNPLQRYDGYYILADLIEIPGLGMRATQHMLYLWKRWFLGDARQKAPSATPGERVWFTCYGAASFIYRTGLVLGIAIYTAKSYPLIGTTLAVWSLLGVMAPPMAGLWRMSLQPDRAQRRRAWLRVLLAGGALAAALALVPVPLRVVAQGVVALPEEANVRAKTGGDILQVLVKPGDRIAVGQPIARLSDSETDAKVARDRADLAELQATYTGTVTRDRVTAGVVADRIANAQRNLAEAQADQANLTVTSPSAGAVVMPAYDDLGGRYLAKGQALAVVWNGSAVVVRTYVEMADIDLLRGRTRAVQIRPAYDSQASLDAHIVRIVPSATDRLASAVLSLEGGGPFAATTDRDSGQGGIAGFDIVPNAALHLSEAMFEIDVQCDSPLPVDFLNGTAAVRFDLGSEPLIYRMMRDVRMVFLKYFNV